MSELKPSKGRTPKVGWLTTRDPNSYLEVGIINMEFVVGLPGTQKSFDSIWVVLDRLTKFACFISVKSSYSAKDYARFFANDIV